MGTRFFRAQTQFADSGTSRYVTILTTNLTTITISSGFLGFRMFNSGSGTLVWGDSSISTNSGNFLYPGMATDFGFVQDSFTFKMVADSLNSYISITEYR